MTKSLIIKIKDEIPMTHYFIYKNKQFPFKYSFFKQYSKYFYNNRKAIQKSPIIQLVDNDVEDLFNFSDETINNFINYVHQQPISLDLENVVLLNYLANKYEVQQLIEATEGYIESNHSQLSIEIIFIHQNDAQFDTKVYEKSILNNFLNYIKDERLFKLNFTILYRIFSQFQSQTTKIETNPEIFNFLFKCLDNYGRQASVLFTTMHFESHHLNILVTKYSKIFDFHFINSQFMKAIYEQQNDLLKKQIEDSIKLEASNKQLMDKINEYEDKISVMENEIEQLKKINKQQEIVKNIFEEKLVKRLEKLEVSYNELKEKANQKFNQEINENESHFIVDCKEGINHYLIKKTGGNIHDNKTIEITTNSCNGDYAHPKCMIDYQKKNYYHSKEDKNFDIEVCFDFKDKKVQIEKYSIKSARSGVDLKNWVIEVSNDRSKWEIIDSHSNESSLKDSLETKAFNTQILSGFYRYVKFRPRL